MQYSTSLILLILLAICIHLAYAIPGEWHDITLRPDEIMWLEYESSSLFFEMENKSSESSKFSFFVISQYRENISESEWYDNDLFKHECIERRRCHAYREWDDMMQRYIGLITHGSDVSYYSYRLGNENLNTRDFWIIFGLMFGGGCILLLCLGIMCTSLVRYLSNRQKNEECGESSE